MKRLVPGLALLVPVHAETEPADDRLPMGIEVVTGFRTD
jgi:hypothetical protein